MFPRKLQVYTTTMNVRAAALAHTERNRRSAHADKSLEVSGLGPLALLPSETLGIFRRLLTASDVEDVTICSASLRRRLVSQQQLPSHSRRGHGQELHAGGFEE